MGQIGSLIICKPFRLPPDLFGSKIVEARGTVINCGYEGSAEAQKLSGRGGKRVQRHVFCGI